MRAALVSVDGRIQEPAPLPVTLIGDATSSNETKRLTALLDRMIERRGLQRSG